MALHRRGGLALALLRRLFVELALARFGQDAGLLAGTLETAQSELERLVLANFDVGHGCSADKLLKVRSVSRRNHALQNACATPSSPAGLSAPDYRGRLGEDSTRAVSN